MGHHRPALPVRERPDAYLPNVPYLPASVKSYFLTSWYGGRDSNSQSPLGPAGFGPAPFSIFGTPTPSDR